MLAYRSTAGELYAVAQHPYTGYPDSHAVLHANDFRIVPKKSTPDLHVWTDYSGCELYASKDRRDMRWWFGHVRTLVDDPKFTEAQALVTWLRVEGRLGCA